MAAKGAGATADRGDHVHHFHHREEVVATNIGRLVNHYRFALQTSSDMHPYHYRFALRTSSSLYPFHYWFVPRTSSGLHPLLRKLICYRPLLPAERSEIRTTNSIINYEDDI